MERKQNPSPSTITCFQWAHTLEAVSHRVTQCGPVHHCRHISITSVYQWPITLTSPGPGHSRIQFWDMWRSGWLPPQALVHENCSVLNSRGWPLRSARKITAIGRSVAPLIPWTRRHPTGAHPSKVCLEKTPKQALQSSSVVFEFPPVYRSKSGNPCIPHQILHIDFQIFLGMGLCLKWKFKEKKIIWLEAEPLWDKATLHPCPFLPPTQQPRQVLIITQKQFRAGMTHTP